MTLDEARSFARGGHVILPDRRRLTYGEGAKGWVWHNYTLEPVYRVFEFGRWRARNKPVDERKMRRLMKSTLWRPIHPKTPLELLAEAGK